MGITLADGVSFSDETQSLTTLTKGAFYTRFSVEQQIALELSDDVLVKVFIREFTLSTHVDLKDEKLIAGVNYLVEIGIVEEADKNQILKVGV